MTPDEKRTELITAIRAGIIDVATVHSVLREVFESEAARAEWTVNLDELALPLTGTIEANTMTLAESVYVMDTLGVGWEAVNPILDARQALAILAAALMHRAGQSESEARETAGKITQEQFADAWGLVEQRPPDPT